MVTDWEKIFVTCIFDKDLYLESYYSKIRGQFFKQGKDWKGHFTGRQVGDQYAHEKNLHQIQRNK